MPETPMVFRSRLGRLGLSAGLLYAGLLWLTVLVLFTVPGADKKPWGDPIGFLVFSGVLIAPVAHGIFGFVSFLGLIRGAPKASAIFGIVWNLICAIVAGVIIIGFSAAATSWR